MATKDRVQNALRLLQQVRPEQVEVTDLPDGSIKILFLPPKPKQPAAETGKWAKVAEAFSREAPLTGIGEEFLKHAKRFRKSLVLKSPFSEAE